MRHFILPLAAALPLLTALPAHALGGLNGSHLQGPRPNGSHMQGNLNQGTMNQGRAAGAAMQGIPLSKTSVTLNATALSADAMDVVACCGTPIGGGTSGRSGNGAPSLFSRLAMTP